MLLIATDEAGYGPKLGPLVIAGTAWRIGGDPDRESIRELFAPLREPCRCGDLSITVDDSKAVYQRSAGLAGLHAVVSTSLRWCEQTEPTLHALLRSVASTDTAAIARSPWLDLVGLDRGWLPDDASESCVSQWGSTGLSLIGVQYRVITAQTFNQVCASGSNKADLLSESTLQLVRTLHENFLLPNEPCEVFCDRHGGRRYYAGVLQHCFRDSIVQVVSEEKQESVYRIGEPSATTTVRFTVKGDSFTPVALSSMHAKYVRERFMEALNRYFWDRSARALKPTAGYPVDAERFLADIEPIVEEQGIDLSTLVRAR